MTSGELLLRGAEEPHVMQAPTRVSGTNTDGNLTNVGLATPVVHVERDMPEYNTKALIDADFSMLSPGTGSISESGQVTVNLSLAVDLHVVVPILDAPRDCRAAPINLTLTSTAPYDGERVTLEDANFSIPNVTPNPPACDGLVGAEINQALAGAGHSLRLTLAGALTPPLVGDPTATSLAVSPSGSSEFGEDVTLTATVAPAPAVPGNPPISGTVRFLDEDTELGTATVAGDGTATLTIADIAAGPAQLRAEYTGAPPDWEPSVSPAVAHTVIADPAISTDVSGLVQGDGAPTPFGVTVVNTGFGRQLDDAQVKVSIRRVSGHAPVEPLSGTPRLVLRQDLDGTPTAVPLTLTAGVPTLVGTIGDADTWDLAPGEELTVALDLAASAAMSPGELLVTFELVSDPSGSPTTLGTASGEVLVVQGARTPTTIEGGEPGDPPFFPAMPATVPLVARQGNSVDLYDLNVEPTLFGVRPSGLLTVSVDGRPVPIRPAIGSTSSPSVRANEVFNITFDLPSDVPTGVRQVQVKYSGDALFAPSQASYPLTVLPSTGHAYECRMQGVNQARFRANIEVDAMLPSLWPTGRDIDLTRVTVDLRSSRSYYDQDAMVDVLSPTSTRDLAFDIAGGTVVPAEVAVSNTSPMIEDDGLGPDRLFSFTKGTGTIPFAAAPGSTTAITLDRVQATVVNSAGFTTGFICLPVDEPVVLGEVTAAGTTLAVSPGTVVGQGNPVTLTATALPVSTGVVEFRDGTTTIGVVPVNAQGVATMTTRALAPGERTLTARFFGGPVATSPSAPVALHVGACGPDFTGEGNGAVVRLVYLELLGRCPDRTGYLHWVDRLDGGTTPEGFARAIARTPEAVGRVVDDAYRTMLGRAADPAGRAFWTRRLQGHGRYDQLLADLAASGEFRALAGGTDIGFVQRIYEQLLDRAPDQAGQDYWVGRLAAGGSPRALVLALARLGEPLQVLVAEAYDEILDRAPTGDEGAAGVTYLRSTGNRSGLYAQLIGTREFFDRAQALPNPSA